MITQLRSMGQLWLWLAVLSVSQHVSADIIGVHYYASAPPASLAAPVISVTPSALTLLNSTQLPGSNSKTYIVSATGLITSDFRITVPSPFVVSAPNAGSYPGGITLPVNSDGTLTPTTITVALLSSSPGTFTGTIANTSGSTTVTVAVSGTSVSPSLSVQSSFLTPFSTTTGTPSAIQTYTITALSQTGGTVTAPTGFDIRTGNNAFGSSLTIPSSLSAIDIPVDVRLSGSTAAQISGSITHRLNNSSNQSIANVAVSGTVSEPATPSITVTPSSLTLVDYSEYPGSFPASFTVSARGLTEDLQIYAPPYYLLTANGKSGPALLIPATNGIVTPTSVSVALIASSSGVFDGQITSWSGSATATVGLSGTALSQSVTVTPSSLSNFTTTFGTPSASQSYTVATQGGLPVLVNAPSGFEIRSGNNPFSSSLTIGTSRSVVQTQIDVRLAGNTIGSVAGTITQNTYFHSSHGIYPVTVSGLVSGNSNVLQVLHRDVDNYADNNAIQPLLEVVNQGSTNLALSSLTLRYYLTVENFVPLTNLTVSYAKLGASNIRMRYVPLAQPGQGALGYIEYSFTPGAGSLMPGTSTGPIQSYIAKTDYSGFNELDDYSYASVRDRVQANQHITAYYNGTLVAGQEPSLVTPRAYLVPYTESKNGPSATQISTYLELRNEGNLPISYNDITVRYYFTTDGSQPLNFELDYTTLGMGNVHARFVQIRPPLTTADTYLELSFANLGQLMPQSSTELIRYRIQKADGGRFNQLNDYSYQEQHASLSPNARVAIYVGNQKYWGNEVGAGARLAANTEAITDLDVLILGNPVRNDKVLFKVSGADSEPIQVELINTHGQVITHQQLLHSQDIQTHQLSLFNQEAGTYLLKVSTPTQRKTIKVVKTE
ncbi:cellulose binding domain-containing protein [Fibrella forsythiae]|uniref:T9SS type A sorting domain-containing protein n=1 Tax=Fibrella forsythiae TaxID=2817061 RepID=A0ABS3JP44_9BACT|nr:cellulose binding domain-containing protein [Fibrella forsythiae]MBO0951776.1 T9SS type A sorting domain-containing protein [Fibrella forsythiae]